MTGCFREARKLFNSRVGKLSDLPKMHEADLAIVYLMGKSYQAFGQIDNASGCFHVVYSQHGFEKQMLKSPYDFPSFVQKAKHELEDIAKDRGENYVNNFQVEPFFERELAKSGCFIATAAYGSSNAPEVLLLRKFRDEVLLTSKVGKCVVSIYYFFSPPLASLVSRARVIGGLVRLMLLPVLKVLRP